MIEMCVREQHEIDWRKLGKGQCWFGEPFRANSEKWQANSDAWKQNGIGQDGDTAEIDQDSGMTNPCSSEILIAPSVRCWMGKHRRDGSAAFHDPFPPEMGQPVASLNRTARRLAFRFH